MEIQAEKSTSIISVNDPRAIRFLLNVDSARILGPLVFQELSASEYAYGLGLKLDAATYLLRRLLAMGLIRIVRQTRRAGSSIKHYAATANCYFLPLSLIPELLIEDWLTEVHRRFDRVFTAGTAGALKRATQEQFLSGLQIDFEPSAGLRYQFALRPKEALDITDLFLNSPEATLDFTRSLSLSRERAKTLQQELVSLLARYQDAPGAEPYRTYLLRINLIEE